MRLYIAGPMTGLPDFNYPAFEEARAQLESEGYAVLCPTDNDDGDEHPSRPTMTMGTSTRGLGTCAAP